MTATGERIEFVVGACEPVAGAGDLGRLAGAERGNIDDLGGFDGWDDADGPGGGPHRRRRTLAATFAGFAVFVLVVAGVRWVSAPVEPVTASVLPTTATDVRTNGSGLVAAGQPQLPASLGKPVDLIVAPFGVDVVWVLGDRGGIARLASGTLDAATVPDGSTDRVAAVALSPDGGTLFAATAGDHPALLALDPVSLLVKRRVAIDRPVNALAATLTSVWVASAGRLEARSFDLRESLGAIDVADAVTWQRLRAATPAGSYITPAGGLPLGLSVTALGADAAGGLRLITVTVEPDGGLGVSPSAPLTGPSSYVTGPSLLVVRVRSGVAMVDRLAGAPGPSWGPFPVGASIWPVGTGPARWALAMAGSAGLTCFGSSGSRVGSAIVGDTGAGLVGPVVATDRAFYGVTGAGTLARGGRGACR